MGILTPTKKNNKIRKSKRRLLTFLLIGIGMIYLLFIPQVSEVYAFGGDPATGELSGSSYEEGMPDGIDAYNTGPEEDQPAAEGGGEQESEQEGDADGTDPDLSAPEECTPGEGTPDEGTPDEGTPDEGTPDEGTPD
ncbi:MAG TPA: hypothetical protein PLV37_00010, partial [Bacillota bacterium]|nr:hypothetical protein [Bacillota bacterium]